MMEGGDRGMYVIGSGDPRSGLPIRPHGRSVRYCQAINVTFRPGESLNQDLSLPCTLPRKIYPGQVRASAKTKPPTSRILLEW